VRVLNKDYALGEFLDVNKKQLGLFISVCICHSYHACYVVRRSFKNTSIRYSKLHGVRPWAPAGMGKGLLVPTENALQNAQHTNNLCIIFTTCRPQTPNLPTLGKKSCGRPWLCLQRTRHTVNASQMTSSPYDEIAASRIRQYQSTPCPEKKVPLYFLP